MPTTGLLLLPPLPGNASIKNKLIDHLSRRFPECEYRDFNLAYRLFSDTSSQLPGSDFGQRSHTHIFVSSHDPERGYVQTTKPGETTEKQSITIAAESIEPFAGLILSKLQPLWYPRQYLHVEDGVSVSLRNNEWILSIGDVKTILKPSSSSTLRGTLIELHYTKATSNEEDNAEEVRQELFQDVVRKIFHGTGETFGDARFIMAETLSRSTLLHEHADWELAHIYMKTLQGQR